MPKAKKSGQGRPSEYSQDIADKLVDHIANGNSLRSFCAIEGNPKAPAIYRWMQANEDFRKQYARACDCRADYIFDEMFEIADDASNDWMERQGEQSTGWQFNGDHVQRSRLRIDTRKWALARMNPKKYGDNIKVEHQTPDIAEALKALADGLPD